MNKDIIRRIFPDVVDQYESGLCTSCRQPAGLFRDWLSEKEYKISGLCQRCQDEVFDLGDNGEYHGDDE